MTDGPMIAVADHPTLRVAAFITAFPDELQRLASPQDVRDLLKADVPAPLAREEAVRSAVRDMLRVGGYKPTGRGKPASEYLVRAATDGTLSSINLAVDVCNAVSLHSGFPISVVDLDRARPPFSIRIADEGATYVFNASGQEIDLAGLVCVFDAEGPCANAVRDSQRTKTHAGTRRTLSVIWGCTPYQLRLAETARWYRELLESAGALSSDVP